MLFLVVSTPRPERPSELAQTRQSYWPWIAKYQASGVCRHVYARVGRGAVAVLDVEATMRSTDPNEGPTSTRALRHPLVDAETVNRLLAAQVAART